VVTSALPRIDRAVGSGRPEEISCSARDRRGEIRIVEPSLDQRLLFDEGLILPIEIEPRLDGNRTVYAEPPILGHRVPKTAYLPSGIWVQFEAPLDSISRDLTAGRRLKPPFGEAGLCHMECQIARQVSAVASTANVLDAIAETKANGSNTTANTQHTSKAMRRPAMITGEKGVFLSWRMLNRQPDHRTIAK